MTKREIMARYGIERITSETGLDRELTDDEADEFDAFCMLITRNRPIPETSPEAPAEHPRR